MRHAIAGNKLNRKSTHRQATVRDIAKATLIHERVCTTKAKAKEARRLVDQLITMGKKGTLAHKRRAFSVLCDHKLVSDLFTTTAPRFTNRQGGYTRIIPYTNRRGDNAELAFLELTEKSRVIISRSKKSSKKDEMTGVKPEGSSKEDQKKTTEDVEKDAEKNPAVSKKSASGLKKMFESRKSGKQSGK